MIPAEDDVWTLVYEGYDPDQEGLRESLCTVGNGVFCTRGALPESRADGVHYPGTYGAGIYDRQTSRIAGHAVTNEDLVNLPNWLVLDVAPEDGEWLNPDRSQVLDHRLTLDLRRGVLHRRSRLRDRQGRTTRIDQLRLMHMGRADVAALRTTLTAEDWDGALRVRSILDGSVENAGVQRYQALEGRHLEPVRTAAVDRETVLLVTSTRQSRVRIAEAARTRVWRRGRLDDVRRTTTTTPALVTQELTVPVRRGEPVDVEKVVTLRTSHDPASTDPAEEAPSWLQVTPDVDALLESHQRAWTHLWDRFTIRLEGYPEAQRIVHLHLFHLLQTASPNSIDLDIGVPPRGWHGEAYRGKVMWDELFVFPLLDLRVPNLSRALLRYRARRLPWARRAAAALGRSGAMYPWQSGSNGREEAQELHLNPRSGRWNVDPTHRQRHIGIAVAWTMWQHYQATGDLDFLADDGAEVILEIARYFSSAAELDAGDGRWHIRGVMGPDEFHTAYPDAESYGIDDNAYTNVMTCWLMQRAAEVLDLVPRQRRGELVDDLRLDDAELARWDAISRRLHVPFHDGVISQFEGYGDLEELDWEALADRHGDIARLDRVLEAEGDTPNRYKASKQADVLMLFYLLSAEELCGLLERLGYEADPRLIPRCIDYYVPRTTNGSTLAAVVHSWVLARAHREEALDRFIRALESDVADVQGGTTAEGIHLAAMAGSVDLVQRCFAGVETRGDALHLNPYWPARLGHLEMAIRYRGHPLTVRIQGREVELASAPGERPPVRICCRDESVELAAGSTVAFPLAQP